MVENISEIDEALTFRMVLPENLPLGLKLRTLNASLPESKSNDPIRSNFQLQSDVLLSFASDDRAVGIQLYENIALTKIASPNSKNLYVEDTTVTVLVDTERDSVSAAWEACAIGLVLTGGPTAQLTEANLVLIVKATLMAC